MQLHWRQPGVTRTGDRRGWGVIFVAHPAHWRNNEPGNKVVADDKNQTA
jgi:hypothetical protein